MFIGPKAGGNEEHPYALTLVGLEAVHVVGAADAPRTQELQQVDLHRRLHKHEVVL